MARQGHSFATAQALRVVYPVSEEGGTLVDVPRDGKTVGEIVMKGNIVMKEVRVFSDTPFGVIYLLTCVWSILTIRRRRGRLFAGVRSSRVIWLLCTPMGRYRLLIEVKISLFLVERFVFFVFFWWT
jgi:hypothetical protein